MLSREDMDCDCAINPAALDLWIEVEDPDVMFIAHNAAFEKAIWRAIMVRMYGWPDIPDERWHDIMAVCAMKGLPLKLERAAMAMNLHAQKDTEGSKITLALSRLNRKGYYDRTPDKIARAMAYCRDDILSELELHRAVRGLGAEERKVWLLDQEINQHGVRLDLKFVRDAQEIVDQATGPLLHEFQALTGINKLASPKLKDWLVSNGLKFPVGEDGELDTSLDKIHIATLLGEDDDEDNEDSLAGEDDDYQEGGPVPLSDGCRRALEIRRTLGSASIKKLAAMQACCGFDERARGLLQYHGAGPGRWAGRLLQPQNFPRPTTRLGKDFAAPDDLIAAISSRDAGYVAALYGNPIGAVASSLRHAIIASDGNLLSVGDFSKIECVIVLALAGATDTAADVLLKGSAVYTDAASKIFGRPIAKHDLFEYTIGKNSILGCGFQMGWRKFKGRYWKNGTNDGAKEVIRVYREDFAPEVPKLWYALEDAAVECVWSGRTTEAYGIVYRLEDGWLTCRLPSGRKLWYRDPSPVKKAMPWDATDIRRGITYRAWKTGQWKIINAYGGLLTENVVQATARDMLVQALFGCKENNLPLVLTVHDEAVTDAPGDNHKLLEQIMCDQPQWVRNLRIPVGAECWSGERYRK